MPDSKTVHVHRLEGCRPTPLAHYLKALGVFRLVAEQADEEVRGWWKDDVFHIATKLDKDELERFFLNEYSPTPIMAPWNGGSGFYPKDNKSGFDPIANSSASRLRYYRESLESTKTLVGDRESKPDKGDDKNRMLLNCRLTWRQGARDWIEAAMTMDAGGEPAFPALLGTGGNDGRLDFTNNFMQRIVSLFDISTPDAHANSEAVEQLKTAFWASPTPTLESSVIGQFFPGTADGTKVNPWDFVLMLEGAIVFRAGVSRRCSSNALPQAAAPFAVRSSGVAYHSSDSADESARGEQWMPLWSNPSNLPEIQRLFLEGRGQVRKQVVQRGTDMARAISCIGTTRGINQFQRYGYIERNGLANFAVPIGRYEVKGQPNQQLLHEAAPWIDHFRRIASSKNAPTCLLRAHRACEEAMVICTQTPKGVSFLSLLETMGQAEDQLLTSPKHAKDNFAKPIPKLSRQWAKVILTDLSDDVETRLAFAIAAQWGAINSKEKRKSIRHHWLPLDGTYFETGESGLAFSPVQCANGLDLERALIAIVNRRLQAMSSGATSGFLPLALTDWRYGATLEHIDAFLQQRVDDAKVLSLARGLMAVDLSYSPRKGQRLAKSVDAKAPENRQPLGGLAAYGLLKLALPGSEKSISFGGDHTITVKCNPTFFRRLQSGNLPKAIELAARQLSIAGLRPRFQIAVGSERYAKRLAASLAFGIAPPTLSRIALGLTAPEINPRERQL